MEITLRLYFQCERWTVIRTDYCKAITHGSGLCWLHETDTARAVSYALKKYLPS